MRVLYLGVMILQCMCWCFYRHGMEHYLTYRDIRWSYHWTTCHNVWRGWECAGCAGVGTSVRGSHARTEEDTGLVHLSKSCYAGNCGSTAVAWDASRRSSPGVGHSHWSVYLCTHHCDAGEVEASGGVDTRGWGAYDTHPLRRNWWRNEAVNNPLSSLILASSNEIVFHSGFT